MAEERKPTWRDRVFTIFTILLGAALVMFGDYWKTFLYKDLDTRAYILDVTALHKNFELHASLVNNGNRQSIVSEFIIIFPFKMGGGKPYLMLNPLEYTVEGIPV